MNRQRLKTTIMTAVAAGVLMIPAAAVANRYRTAGLERLAAAVGVKVDAAELSDTVLTLREGTPAVIEEIGATGEVRHIGYQIFPPEIKQGPRGDVLRFVERYALAADLSDHKLKSLSTQLAEDEVTFAHGDLPDLKRMAGRDDLRLSVSVVDGREYQLRWTSEDGAPQLEMGFPVDHCLLLGASADELYQTLYAGLQQYELPEPTGSIAPRTINPNSEEDFFVEEGKFYMLKGLNSDRYYVRMPEQYYELTNSERYPVETLSNMFVTDEIPNDNQVAVRLVDLPDKEPIEMPLMKFSGYMRSTGCEPYFGLIDIDGTEVTFMLLYKNETLGYAHSMRGTADLADFPTEPTTVRLRMLSFIPISRITNLFNDYVN